MKILEALWDFLRDLAKGDPVALGLTGLFAIMGSLVAAVWIVDYFKQKKRQKKSKKGESNLV